MGLVISGENRYLIKTVIVNGRSTSRSIAKGDEAVELYRLGRIEAQRRHDARATARQQAVDRREQIATAKKHLLREIEGLDRKIARMERATIAREAEATRQVADKIKAFDHDVELIAVEVKSISDTLMKAAGFHMHRWAWRKKRSWSWIEQGGSEVTTEIERSKKPDRAELAKAGATVAEWLSPENVAKTVDRWIDFDTSREPGTEPLVSVMTKAFSADPVQALMRRLLVRFSGLEYAQELLRRQCIALQGELEGPTPITAVERLIIERIVVCWLDLHTAHLRMIDGEQEELSIAERDYRQRAHDRAHRRHISTLRSLALIRSRALPALLSVRVAVKGADGALASASVDAGD